MRIGCDQIYEASTESYEDILESYGKENEYGLTGEGDVANLDAETMESVYDRIERGLMERYGKHKSAYVPRVMNAIAYSLADLAWYSDTEKVRKMTREDAVRVLTPSFSHGYGTWSKMSAMAGIEKVMDKHQEKFDEWDFDSGLRRENFDTEEEFYEAESEIRDREYEEWLPGGFDRAIVRRWHQQVEWHKERGGEGLWPYQILEKLRGAEK